MDPTKDQPLGTGEKTAGTDPSTQGTTGAASLPLPTPPTSSFYEVAKSGVYVRRVRVRMVR